jgi:hypothetical protein
MTFSHNAFYNMRLRGDGNLGIGSLNPNLAGLVVNKKVGNSHAIFGDNTSGVSIESNFPGIHFNSYYNGSRKTISTGYTAGAEMNPTTGDFSIYTSPASTTSNNNATVYNRLNIDKNGTVGISNVIELGYGQTKQVDNGKIALNGFGEGNTLSIVGGGVAADGADRRIKFFANGESDFTGPIKFSGPLKPSGDAGALGQVLTSNGPTTSPTWSNSAYGNNSRVLVTMGQLGVLPGSTIENMPITATLYNTNTTDITVNYNYITINKSGLYHFDLKGTFHFENLSPSTSYIPHAIYSLEAGYSSKIQLPFEYWPELKVSSVTGRHGYYTDINVNTDVYITAPANIGFQYLYPTNTFIISTKASLGAYLIQE